MHNMARFNILACFIHFVFAGSVFAQGLLPSNSTDVISVLTYPHYNVNSTDSFNFTSFQVVPLGISRRISRHAFLGQYLKGSLVSITPQNANAVSPNDIALLSCDPEDYPDNIDASGTFRIMAERNVSNMVILYSQTSIHCNITDEMSEFSGRFSFLSTTVNAQQAESIANLNVNESSGATASIRPDPRSYTDLNSNYYSDSTPGTAVTMIVLYSITGIITAIFVTIIVTGAIRAHRHPERYGPRIAANGRTRQSRARGIARAMLETLPIVKFGDQQKTTNQKEITPSVGDVEMTGSITTKGATSATVKEQNVDPSGATHVESPTIPTKNETDISENSLQCSICTEDFQKGEEVRVLPCDHKFHPDCVDPWLLNVSGTCPLCRIDLRTQSNVEATADTPNAPPLSSPSNTSTVQALRAALALPRDERIAALRRFRQERRNRGGETPVRSGVQNEEERRGLTQRLRDRFRVRTSQHPGVDEAEATRRLSRAQSRLWMP